MHDELARSLTAVRQANDVSLDMQKLAAEDVLGRDFGFDKMRIDRHWLRHASQSRATMKSL